MRKNKEIWRNVVGYEGIYEVSNFGRVKSLPRKFQPRERILTPCNRGEYLAVTLCMNGSEKLTSIHRLVAMAFIPNPNNYPQVNHKDEDKTNNHVNNLEWCTSKYNNTYGSRIKKSVKKQSKPVIQLYCGQMIKKYPSINSVKLDGYTPQAVSECCRGIRNYHKGFEWRFAND